MLKKVPGIEGTNAVKKVGYLLVKSCCRIISGKVKDPKVLDVAELNLINDFLNFLRLRKKTDKVMTLNLNTAAFEPGQKGFQIWIDVELMGPMRNVDAPYYPPLRTSEIHILSRSAFIRIK